MSIRKMSLFALILTVVLSLFVSVVSFFGWYEFKTLVEATEQYAECQSAAAKMEDASENLTEQVRLYSMTGDVQYMNSYIIEAKVERNRDKALNEIKKCYNGSSAFGHLSDALDKSTKLMEIEYYSMRLASEGYGIPKSGWPEEVAEVSLSPSDASLSSSAKKEKARLILFDSYYEESRNQIMTDVKECTGELINEKIAAVSRSRDAFEDIYWKLIVCSIIFCICSITIVVMIRNKVVIPLIHYNECIRNGIIFPVEGAEELQNLALTYNEVFIENQENQKLIRHQAEHDGLTDIFNRRSFERLLKLHEDSGRPFALFIIDVDRFKLFNDRYGHAVGDEVLKNVAIMLKDSFRNIDYVCRIGGDEFAVIMVEMPAALKYVAEEKMKILNRMLETNRCEEYIDITLSIGIAFSEDVPSDMSVFNAADSKLYEVKENGRNGYRFFGSDY